MAATSQERNILHVKDVFSKAKKGSHAPANTLDKRNNNKSGQFMIRASKDKEFSITELPVPPPRRKKLLSSSSSDKMDSNDTYMTPKQTVDIIPMFSEGAGGPPPGQVKPPTPSAHTNGGPALPDRNSQRNSGSNKLPRSPVKPIAPPPPPSFQPPPPPQQRTTPPQQKTKSKAPSPPSFDPPPPPLPRSPPPTTPPVRALSDFMTKSDEDIILSQEVEKRRGSLVIGDENDEGDSVLSPSPSSKLSNGTQDHLTTTYQKKSGGGIYEKNTKNRKKEHQKKDSEVESSILTNMTAASSGYHSGNDTDGWVHDSPRSKKSSSFEEEEYTMDFGSDDSASHKQQIFQEYGGEDYSMYIDEDHDAMESQSYHTSSRRIQRQRMAEMQREERLRKLMEKEARKRAKSPGGDSRRTGIKEKIANAFTLDRPSRKSQLIPGVKPAQQGRSIHQLSFMDTKMGQYADSTQMSEYMARDLETKSDLGMSSKSKRLSSWAGKDLPSWYNETLSASTLRKNKGKISNTMTTSTPNLFDGSETGSGSGSRRRGESYSEFDADVVKKEKSKGMFSRFKFWKSRSKKHQKNQLTLSKNSDCVDIAL